MMSITILVLIAGCLLGVLVFGALLVGLVVIMNSGERDRVSTARQGWLHRRSEQDQDGW